MNWFVWFRDAGRTAWLSGPWASKEEADKQVRPTMHEAEGQDPHAVWYERGVALLSDRDAQKVTPVFGRLEVA